MNDQFYHIQTSKTVEEPDRVVHLINRYCLDVEAIRNLIGACTQHVPSYSKLKFTQLWQLSLLYTLNYLITLFYFCRDLPSYLAVDLMAKNVLVVSSRIKLEELVACLGQKTEH